VNAGILSFLAQMIALLQVRIELDRELAAVPGRPQRHFGEALQDRPAGIGAELESAGAVELVRASQQGQAAFTHEIGKLDPIALHTLGHGDHQRNVRLRDLTPNQQFLFPPPEQFRDGVSRRKVASHPLDHPVNAIPRVVELEEHPRFLL